MKRVFIFSIFLVGFQGIVHSQNANPYISIGMNPFKVQTGKSGTLEVTAGNAGVTPIQPNTMIITIMAGANAEITPTLSPESDSRWSVQSLGKGSGNTMVLINSGKSPFNAFDVGRVNVLVQGKTNTVRPNIINAFIKYTRNTEQGNTSSLDDQSMTSLSVGSGTIPASPVKSVPPTVIKQQQDFTITANGCEAILKWKVNSNNKTEKIEVEYSKNNIEFTNLGEVKPIEGNTNDFEYKYDQGNGRGYYRLKIVLKGNIIEYSKMKEIVTTCVVKRGF